MAAIDLTKLKRLSTHLVTLCDSPEKFQNELHNLLETFSDRSLRLSSMSDHGTPLNTYRVPKQVIYSITRNIEPIMRQSPGEFFNLSDYLWADEVIESKLIALFIIGRISIDFTKEITARLVEWEKGCTDIYMINNFINLGLYNLRHDSVAIFIMLAETWITTKTASTQKIGIKCIQVLITDTIFDNIPLMFRLVTIVLKDYSLQIETDLGRLLKLLLQKYPDETLNFLNNFITVNKNKKVVRLIRQSLANL
jgi:hypothetical protein